jgi:hypothetical protein
MGVPFDALYEHANDYEYEYDYDHTCSNARKIIHTKSMEEKPRKETKTETQVLSPPGLGMRFLPTPDTTDIHYHLTNPLTTPSFCLVLPSPRGGMGWGRAARQGKRDKYSQETK